MRRFHTPLGFLLCLCALFTSLKSSEANYIIVSAPAPAIITRADYINTFTFPSPSHLSMPGQVLRSADGYLFTYDTIGRRYYFVPPSYVLAPQVLAFPVRYTAAPYYITHVPTTGVALPSMRLPASYPGPLIVVP